MMISNCDIKKLQINLIVPLSPNECLTLKSNISIIYYTLYTMYTMYTSQLTDDSLIIRYKYKTKYENLCSNLTHSISNSCNRNKNSLFGEDMLF